MYPAYPVIYPEELQLLGVVTYGFNSTRASEVTMLMYGLADSNSFYSCCLELFLTEQRGKRAFQKGKYQRLRVMMKNMKMA